MPEQHSCFGYSAVSTFEQCPFRYKCQYIDGLQALPSDDPSNALIIGTAMHKGIETDVETAISEYFGSYLIITDQHIDEEIKLRYLIPKVKEVIPKGFHELKVVDTNFMGTLDLLVPVEPKKVWHPSGTINSVTGEVMGHYVTEESNQFDLYDFKYSNNWIRYMDSRQLHLYKYYWEKRNPGKHIRNMYFVFIPKVQIRQKKTEDLYQFRQRLLTELDKITIKVEPVPYDPRKVIEHLELTQDIMMCQDYPKNPTRLCDFCEFKQYCQSDGKEDWMIYGKE